MQRELLAGTTDQAKSRQKLSLICSTVQTMCLFTGNLDFSKDGWAKSYSII
jgi:NADPH-dependent 7-cyano-7-deazaguanine reductase QueF